MGRDVRGSVRPASLPFIVLKKACDSTRAGATTAVSSEVKVQAPRTLTTSALSKANACKSHFFVLFCFVSPLFSSLFTPAFNPCVHGGTGRKCNYLKRPLRRTTTPGCMALPREPAAACPALFAARNVTHQQASEQRRPYAHTDGASSNIAQVRERERNRGDKHSQPYPRGTIKMVLFHHKPFHSPKFCRVFTTWWFCTREG